MDASHPILYQAREYIIAIMTGVREFPDHPEKNDRWHTGRRMFLASTLSLIQPDHSLLDADRILWREIASRTSQSGEYDEDAEIRAQTTSPICRLPNAARC